MKNLTLIAALTACAALLSAGPAFAADAAPTAQTTGTDTVAMSAAPASAKSMPVDQTVGKTRAEVYQELIRSEQSGEMQRLDSTLYAN